jgi:glucose/arabinose dehydrogenase
MKHVLPDHLLTREFVWEKENEHLYRELFRATGYEKEGTVKTLLHFQKQQQEILYQFILHYSLDVPKYNMERKQEDQNPFELLNDIYNRERELILVYESYPHLLKLYPLHQKLTNDLRNLKTIQLNWLNEWKKKFSENGWEEENHQSKRKSGASFWLEKGYKLELVSDKLTFPTSITFNDAGELFVGESGFSYGPAAAESRILHIQRDGSKKIIASDFGRPLTGLTWHKGNFYVITGGFNGKVYRVSPEGHKQELITGLRGGGDHFTSDIVFGPDDKMYFSVGTVTNTSVVGRDNFLMGWLGQKKDYHDVPARDLKLRGKNYETPNFLTKTDPDDKVKTGSFHPFGEPSKAGEMIKGQKIANGVIYRANADGSNLEIIADGIRNIFGLSFSPEGKLFGTNNGMDFRGSRPVEGDWDSFYEIKSGWYGWPDYASGLPITLPYFKPKGHKQPEFVLAEHPPLVAEPLIRFEPHTATQKFDFCRNEYFASKDEIFFAQFGDQSPMTGLTPKPKGYRVVRVNPKTGKVKDFLINLKPGEEKKVGPERPLTPKFSPDGRSLYLVDFGLMKAAPGVIYPYAETGKLWRITKS